ncbi:lipoprotein LpqH [Gordonia sp. NB41Y]|uniref:lipoprotein LpqH n=1 Tax=Gordonia sp. NB41Y TaxID=875808 RepID=UPI0021C5A2E5|nr:lipoprotein LpqH [Gordonia sp. NB41Y]WLP91634.1 lipoprotein LpqH [Gordonia sp. NB41Y]
MTTSVLGAAALAVVLTACGSDDSDSATATSATTSATTTGTSTATESDETSSTSTTDVSETGSAGVGRDASVVVDGDDVDLGDATVGCTEGGGRVTIGISGADIGAVGAVVTSGDSPEVESVGLGSVDGVTLAYQKDAGDGSGEATKKGDTYTIKGKATGIDISNPTSVVTKSYEITVTCP